MNAKFVSNNSTATMFAALRYSRRRLKHVERYGSANVKWYRSKSAFVSISSA